MKCIYIYIYIFITVLRKRKKILCIVCMGVSAPYKAGVSVGSWCGARPNTDLCGPDVGPMWVRCRLDVGSMWVRFGLDMGPM